MLVLLIPENLKLHGQAFFLLFLWESSYAYILPTSGRYVAHKMPLRVLIYIVTQHIEMDQLGQIQN